MIQSFACVFLFILALLKDHSNSGCIVKKWFLEPEEYSGRAGRLGWQTAWDEGRDASSRHYHRGISGQGREWGHQGWGCWRKQCRRLLNGGPAVSHRNNELRCGYMRSEILIKQSAEAAWWRRSARGLESEASLPHPARIHTRWQWKPREQTRLPTETQQCCQRPGIKS